MHTEGSTPQNTKQKVTRTILLFGALPAVLILVGWHVLSLALVQRSLLENCQIRLGKHVTTNQLVIDHHIADFAAIIKFISEVHPRDELSIQSSLQSIFDTLDREYNHIFEDLGVINAQGYHLAYVGPYDLLDMNYSQEQWFMEVMDKGRYVSDVFLGYRRVPHFILAVKQDNGKEAWILRATINVYKFSSILDNIRFGRTGEVFIVNSEGVLQTRSRMHGNIMDHTGMELLNIDPHEGVEIYPAAGRTGKVIVGQTWLSSKPNWLLVAQQDERDALAQSRAIMVNFFLMLAAGIALLGASALITIKFILRHFKLVDMEKKLMDDQMIQSQKLAAIGQLSSGIAHEINNPLAIIGEEAGWLQDILKRESMKDFKEADEFKDSLREIVTQAGRCREITHKLLSFARKMDSVIKDVDINALVEEMATMREKDASLKSIKITRSYEKDLPMLHSEPSLLRQVFLNLINNAIDAMRGGGEIRIGTAKNPDRPDSVIVTISDTGVGIPAENLARIFDPFFTTKPPGKGTGLGLSICHGIIKKLGGEILVNSVPSKGTTFTIILPLEPPAPQTTRYRSKEVGDTDMLR
jgi:two-component system, NtrC family, sensor kinase